MAEGVPTFKIPGNIKQGFLPFVIDPLNSINTIAKESLEVSGNPQFFSYRNKIEVPQDAGRLGIYPNDEKYYALDKDISLKLLYPDDYQEYRKRSLRLFDIIDSIPAVSIREFLPDTRLDQCLNFFKDIFSAMQDMIASTKDKQGDKQLDTGNLGEKIWSAAQFTMLYLLGIEWKTKGGTTYNEGGKNGFFKSFVENAGDNSGIKYNNDFADKVRNFPFMFYYRLQSCVTTNIYEIPAVTDGKIINQSDGKAGWGSGSGLLESGGFRAGVFLNKIPIVGELANTLLGNIGINYMPWWNPEEGAKTTTPDINIKFDLFNDTIDKAVANFIFVNTIIPGNRWIQYGMFQHSSNLYDVKIEGLNRLFACSASFNVTYDGVLRNPPKNFFDGSLPRHLSLKGHVSGGLNEEQFLNDLQKNNLVKIPDVYHVEMSFKSLLPANFNNFIFAYANNVNHMTEYKDKPYQKGIGGAIGTTIGQFVNGVKEAFKKNDVNAGFGSITKDANADGFMRNDDGDIIE